MGVVGAVAPTRYGPVVAARGAMSQRLFQRTPGGNYYVFLGRDASGEKVARSTGCRDRRAAEARAVELERQFRAPATDAAPHASLADALSRALPPIAETKPRERRKG